jgi:hypothetical protein
VFADDLPTIILPGHFVGLIGSSTFFCPAPESFPGRTAETGGEAAQDEGDDEQGGEEVDFLLHISDRLRFSSGKYTEDSLKSNNNLSKFNKLSLKFSKHPLDDLLGLVQPFFPCVSRLLVYQIRFFPFLSGYGRLTVRPHAHISMKMHYYVQFLYRPKEPSYTISY